MLAKALSTKLTPATASILLVFLYNDWVLAPLLNPAMSTRASLISEISSRTQPYHWVFQILDIAAGAVTLALVPCLLRLLKKQPVLWKWMLLAGIALIGADSIIDALLPISCAPSVDVQCSLTSFHSAVTTAHMIESTAIGIVTFVAPVLWWVRFRRRPLLAESSRLFVILQLGVGLGIVVAHRNETAVVGLLQRFYEVSISTWLAVVLGSAIRAVQRHRADKRAGVPAIEPIEL